MVSAESSGTRAAHVLLVPLGLLFGFGAWARGKCYDAGLFSAERVAVPVIAVGNMTAGGTGKTPMVEYLIRLLRPLGKRLAVVSRGYLRSGTGTFVVSDGTTLFGDAAAAGDEPFQIARKFRDVVVIVDEQKVRAARRAVIEYGAEVILVDDGFQHRALGRDLDIVMVDSTKPLRGTRFLPAGLRREPLDALARADMLVYSRCADPAHHHEALPEAKDAIVSCVRFSPTRCVALSSQAEMPLASLKGAPVTGFCGIGDPQSFRTMLEESGCDVRECRAFPDHATFTPESLRAIAVDAARAGARYVLTTEKDAGRISSDPALAALLPGAACYIEIEAEIIRGREEFHRRVLASATRAAA